MPTSCFTSPIIPSCIKKLKNCPKDKLANTSVFQLCKNRGQELSNYFLQCWTNIVFFFINYFIFDISATPLLSFSLLSYQIVWTKYSRNAGIYHQGLEKTKLAYESIFRQYSHGGYSFSCKDQIVCNEPLNKNISSHLAKTIFELDITSSYGFAGSNIQCPKGFCNAFFNTGNGTLKLMEPIV